MTKYLCEEVTVERRAIAYMVKFPELPDDVKEAIAFEDLKKISGCQCLSFYCDPHVGDFVPYGGHDWVVTQRSLTPNKYRSRGERVIPTIFLKHVAAIS